MSITINLNKAKDIWVNKWRDARISKLQALDVEYMRALEQNDSAKLVQIANKKQELRDVTTTPIDATTPEEIKAVWPEILS